MMQLIVNVSGYAGGLVVVDAPSGVTADEAGALIVDRIRASYAPTARTGPLPRLTLSQGGIPLAPCAALFASGLGEPILLRAAPAGGALRGGKGGFGANLRAQGRASGAPRSSNFGACRDLSGRRLKSVNDEARLRAWLDPAAVAERAAAVAGGAEPREASGPSGHAGWMLGVPSWSEGKAPKADGVWRRPRKTVMCADWETARAPGRRVPGGAPRSWGCPRGRACEFAHGVEELRAEGKVAALAAAREAREREVASATEAATRGLYRYESGGLRGPVAEGLLAAASAAASSVAPPPPARKRARVDDESEIARAASAADEEEPWDGGGGFFRRTVVARNAAAASAQSIMTTELPENTLSRIVVPAISTAAPCIALAPIAHSWRASDWCRVVGGAPEGASIEYRHTATTSERADVSASMESSSAAAGLAAFSRADVAGVAEFATVTVDCASALLGEGSTVYWEAEVSTAGGGAIQIGWASAPWTPTPASDSEGVSGTGDDDKSWAFDVARGLKWHGSGGEGEADSGAGGAGAGAGANVNEDEKLAPGSAQYGRVAAEGDVVGVSANFHKDAVSLSFSLNGDELGTAFDVPRSAIAHGLIAAVSLDAGEAVTINLGAAGFAYAPPGACSLWSLRCEPSPAPVSAPQPAVAPLAPATEPQVDLEALISAAKGSEMAITVTHLKHVEASAAALGSALTARGVKAGGTWEERAVRLVAVLPLTLEEIPKKYRAKA